MTKILLVEDNKELCESLRDWLEREYAVDIVNDGLEGQELLGTYTYDVLVLDWDLPSMSGIDLCCHYRKRGGQAPIIMLTGKDQLNEKMRGFESGADDYLTKPFQISELLVRIKALLRRSGSKWAALDVLIAGAISLDNKSKRVVVDGNETKLQPAEFSLLQFFMLHPNETFSAEQLIDRLWSSSEEVSLDAIYTTMTRMRKKLTSKSGCPLETVRGFGYRLNMPKD